MMWFFGVWKITKYKQTTAYVCDTFSLTIHLKSSLISFISWNAELVEMTMSTKTQCYVCIFYAF